MNDERTEWKRGIYSLEEKAMQHVMAADYEDAQKCFLEAFKQSLSSNDSKLIIEAWHHYYTFIKSRTEAGDFSADWLDDEAINMITGVLEANTENSEKLSDTCISALAVAISVVEGEAP